MTRRAGLVVRLSAAVPGARAPRTLVTRLLADEYAARGGGPATVNVLLLSDADIARYNVRYKKHEGPTDVLAFPDGEADPRTGRVHLGDIAAGLETARRVAAERGHDWRDELALYALHGLLHLLGMKDGTPAGRAAMWRAQTAAFRRLGRTPPPES